MYRIYQPANEQNTLNEQKCVCVCYCYRIGLKNKMLERNYWSGFHFYSPGNAPLFPIPIGFTFCKKSTILLIFWGQIIIRVCVRSAEKQFSVTVPTVFGSFFVGRNRWLPFYTMFQNRKKIGPQVRSTSFFFSGWFHDLIWICAQKSSIYQIKKIIQFFLISFEFFVNSNPNHFVWSFRIDECKM